MILATRRAALRGALGSSLVVLLAGAPAAAQVDASVAPVASASPGFQKLDARLRGLTLRGHSLGSAANATALVPLFIETSDTDALSREIEKAGGIVGARTGRVVTARVPASSLLTLGALDHVARMAAARPIRKRLDRALPAMNVDKVHSGASPLWEAITGKGVVVGIVDDGLDLSHSAFKTSAGKTRVAYFWDQSGSGTSPSGFSYGTECTSTTIDSGKCTQSSTEAHGTHVTGIAAGATVGSYAYEGVAPDADIVFVNLDFTNDTGVCDGVSYIFKKAAALGEPAVVNLSLGSQGDPHDGTSLLSQCIDELTGPGKIVVAAAGNEGEGNVNDTLNTRVYVHSQFKPSSSTSTVIPFLFAGSATSSTSAAIDQVTLWYDSGSVSLRLGVLKTVSPAAWDARSSTATLSSSIPNSNLTLSQGSVGPYSIVGADTTGGSTGGFEVLIEDGDNDGREGGVTWGLEITGTAPQVDLFIDPTEGAGFITGGTVTPDNLMSVGAPAVSKNVIAVGSYVTRSSWTSGGSTWGTTDPITGEIPTLGARSLFSSVGPARRTDLIGTKPEITAPGEVIISTLASFATDEPTTGVIKSSPNGYAVMSGTSMASPAVAGVVALLLSQQPRLTVDEVRSILMTSADGISGVTTPNTQWGAGKVNAFAALQELCSHYAGDAGIPGCSSSSVADAGSLRDASAGAPDASAGSGGSGGAGGSGGHSSASGAGGGTAGQTASSEGTGGTTHASTATSAGSGGGSAGSGGTRATSSTTASGASGTESDAVHAEGGCSCRTAPASPSKPTWVALAAGCAALLAQRRGRRRQAGLSAARSLL